MASRITVSSETASEKHIKAVFTLQGTYPARCPSSLDSQAGSLEGPSVGNVDVHVGREELCFLVGPLCGHLQIKTAFQNKNGL